MAVTRGLVPRWSRGSVGAAAPGSQTDHRSDCSEWDQDWCKQYQYRGFFGLRLVERPIAILVDLVILIDDAERDFEGSHVRFGNPVVVDFAVGQFSVEDVDSWLCCL